jgi:hypothetical protein
VETALLIVDLRSSLEPPEVTVKEVRKRANQHFSGNDTGVLGARIDTAIGGRLTHLYHVESVARNLWVCSIEAMDKHQTRAAASAFVARPTKK